MYTELDARKCFENCEFLFVLAGAKPVRGNKKYPSYYELNSSRKTDIKILKGENYYKIIVPLIGKLDNENSSSPARKGDSITFVLYNIELDEALQIAVLLNYNILYDYNAIQKNDLQEGKDIIDFIVKVLPKRMNKVRN